MVLYDLPEENLEKSELVTSWNKFVTAMISLADVEEVCRLSDSRLDYVAHKKALGQGEGTHLFVMNPTTRTISADLIFKQAVTLFDAANTEGHSKLKPMKQFQMTVPPRGVVPLIVQGLNADADQRLEAALIAAETKKNIDQIAHEQFAGFDRENDLSQRMSENKWN